MKLNLSERVFLLGLLPVTGKYESLILMKSIDNKIKITSQEVNDYDIVTIENGLQWNNKGAVSIKDVKFNDAEQKVIHDLLKSTSESEKLPLQLMNLYKLIVMK